MFPLQKSYWESAKAPMFPMKIWNFKGAYVVWFMTAVSCSACTYTCYHYIKDSPDFLWRREMRQDELTYDGHTQERAKAHVNNSFFRWLASSRIKEDINDGKDTRIFRF